MAHPFIHRELFDTPGDVLPRPHANCYWLIPGRVLAGEHPAEAPAREVAARIDALLDAGIRQFIDLTEAGERATYAPASASVCAIRGSQAGHRRLAIRDLDVPSAALMRTILDAMYEAMDKGELVYVHCWAGVEPDGHRRRLLLREQGLTADEALAVIARKWRVMEKCHRHTRSPEHPEQFALITRWGTG
jgi:protein-tyrosine phosphatase